MVLGEEAVMDTSQGVYLDHLNSYETPFHKEDYLLAHVVGTIVVHPLLDIDHLIQEGLDLLQIVNLFLQ